MKGPLIYSSHCGHFIVIPKRRCQTELEDER